MKNFSKYLGVFINKNRSLTKKEVAVSIIFFLILWVILSGMLYFYNIRHQYGDGTFAAQILYNFKNGFAQSSSFSASTLDAYKTIWYKPVAFVCNNPLVTNGENFTKIAHLYLVAYLLLPLAKLFDPFILIAVIHAFIYSFILFFAYLFSRDKKISIMNSILLTVLISQHPLWRMGLFGQFYFNRLFLPIIVLIIWLITRDKINHFWVTVLVILGISVNEIYGIALSLLLFAFILIFNKKALQLWLLAILSILTSIMMIGYIQAQFGAGSTQTKFIDSILKVDSFISLIKNNLLVKNSLTFLYINLFSLGILAFLVPRNIIFLTIIFLPNLFINIGGAEKVGWATHYHTAYFIPLIWASIMGFSTIKFKKGLLSTILLVLMIFFSASLESTGLGIMNKPEFTLKEIASKILRYIKYHDEELAYRKMLRDSVSEDASITGSEAAVYNFIDHPIYYYPMNIDIADKVIFYYNKQLEGDDRFSSINYGHQDQNLDSCIKERMKNRFDFSTPKIVGEWAIIGRKLKD